MKFGFVMPYGDARKSATLAAEAEKAGWDGFFVWEPVWGFDAWILLAAAAMATDKIRLGTMITPVSRMRPWKLASETVTLDHLSGGRLTLSVGLGAPDTGFDAFGEETDRKKRAQLLDEGLDILTGLWQGQPFSYKGAHYKVEPTEFYPPPPPVQQPIIPIWVVGAWKREKSMQRVLRYDGILPNAMAPRERKMVELTPDHVREIAAYIDEHIEPKRPFDIVVEGETNGEKPGEAIEKVQPWSEAGATWWLEARWSAISNKENQTVLERIQQGPPREF